MAKFIVDGLAEYSRSFLVEAGSRDEAVSIVEKIWDEGTISLKGFELGDIHFEPAYETEESMVELAKAYEESGEKPISR